MLMLHCCRAVYAASIEEGTPKDDESIYRYAGSRVYELKGLDTDKGLL